MLENPANDYHLLSTSILLCCANWNNDEIAIFVYNRFQMADISARSPSTMDSNCFVSSSSSIFVCVFFSEDSIDFL